MAETAPRPSSPANQLEALVRSQLEHAVDGARRGLKVYESLRNLSEVIGAQYGDRVLYELIQNAHDAHAPNEAGEIVLRLTVQGETEGTLYVANRGRGFRLDDVEAIRNLGISNKDVGEGIGNKGLGFRSVEALSEDVRIYSQFEAQKAECFEGFCFRFADVPKIEALLEPDLGVSPAIRRTVATTIPRYLVSVPLNDQPQDVVAYARTGYATVIALPLRTRESVALASSQMLALADLQVPLLLFLDRIAKVSIEVERPGVEVVTRTLRRRQEYLGAVDRMPGCQLFRVRVGEAHRFLVVRRQIDKDRVLSAVKASLSAAPQLRRWLKWKGEPVVSVAVAWGEPGIVAGRFYNFLPMAEAAKAPIFGYIDAPFFTDIDRRSVRLDLPLNDTLLTTAAEACTAAALSIITNSVQVSSRAGFDLVAWERPYASRLDDALKGLGTSLRAAKIFPAVSDNRSSWASLSEIVRWPNGRFSALTPREISRCAGAALVSPRLGQERIRCLEKLAEEYAFRSLAPTKEQIASWAEIIARSLADRHPAWRVWAEFYEDVRNALIAIGSDLRPLAGKAVLLDRSGRLQLAVAANTQAHRQVYVRTDGSQRPRSTTGAPLPPQSLSRRFLLLDDHIPISQETVLALERAGLLRPYDAVEALAGLESALGKRPSDDRRREALIWAFQVFRNAGTQAEKVLKQIDLHVLARSGWLPASRASFSASWGATGRLLENFLVEAADLSPDCRRASECLLLAYSDWPVSGQYGKTEWKRFLEALGVNDGVRPIAGQLDRKGTPSGTWNGLLQQGTASQGLNGDWCSAVKTVSFSYPNTYYQISGEVWRLPGQLEHQQLPESAKATFSKLVLEHLRAHGDTYLRFQIGRFERARRDWDEQKLPTPLAVFLKCKMWLATAFGEEIAFRRPLECWAAREKRGGPPRFVERVPEEVADDLVENMKLADLLFSRDIGLRDWRSPSSVVDRLGALASVASDLPSHHRPRFREEYRRAWSEAGANKVSLPPDIHVVVARHGRVEIIRGDRSNPADIVVTEDPRSFEARVLSEAGRPVLDIGDADANAVISLLELSKAFKPMQLDGVKVQLLVDGEPFAPLSTDPTLVSHGLDWLPDVVVLANELLAEQLQRGIQRTTLEVRTRAIRLRRCQRISLVVEGEELHPQDGTPFYAFENEETPTLIVTGGAPLTWRTLVNLAGNLSRLIDRRLQSLETLLLRLNVDRARDDLEAPSEEQLSNALKCDIGTVQEHLLALRSETGRVTYMLVPLVAYFAGIEAARRLRSDIDRIGARFDPRTWLASNLIDLPRSAADIIDACQKALNRAELRRFLNIDYGGFNACLLELSEPILSNETELRRVYNAYLQDMKQAIIDRLRRRYLADFLHGRSLGPYLEYRKFAFLQFDESWIATRETLDREVVEIHVAKLLGSTIGNDTDVELSPLSGLLDTNRKSVQRVAQDIAPLLSVWCQKNAVPVPAPWESHESQTVVRFLENAGLLDFNAVRSEEVPGLCRRAGCWPTGMPEGADPSALGLDPAELRAEHSRQDQERQQAEVARRTIVFGGASFDTADPNFALGVRDVAEQSLTNDNGWLERSPKKVRLETFTVVGEIGASGGSGSGGRGRARAERQLSEIQRSTMGLASEWLAYRYLQNRHSGAVDEESWVSTNRRRFFGGSDGDDALGFDFRVKTPQVDWLYEVKSSMDDSGEFELTANEIRVASSVAKDGRRRYRILYVPFVFSPDRWYVLELPNPMGEQTRNQFRIIGRGSVRLRFERR